MVKIDNVDVSDKFCIARTCFHVGEDKGSFTVGRGYTSYHAKPVLVCMTRHCHGCPIPLPNPDAELARCCWSPRFAGYKHRPSYQTCQVCRKRMPIGIADLLRSLPKRDYSRCRHASVRIDQWACEPCWYCPDCGGYWDTRPVPHQSSETAEVFSARRIKLWVARNSVKT